MLDYRDFPAVAPKIAPQGSHDACFLPRNRHFTGDVRIHEIAFAQGELWIVATNFSCLATLDAQHSFVPRWTPPFITELVPEDRCHLNGLCVVEDTVRYVTALGESDDAGGWRENKSPGGVLIDVASGETVLGGLLCPTRLAGTTGACGCLTRATALSRSRTSTSAASRRSPSCPASLAASCSRATSRLWVSPRSGETATFGGLPLSERIDERLCGIWAVDTRSGETLGLLRFEELVQEIFDVALLTGLSWPEIAEESSDAASQSFVLPN